MLISYRPKNRSDDIIFSHSGDHPFCIAGDFFSLWYLWTLWNNNLHTHDSHCVFCSVMAGLLLHEWTKWSLHAGQPWPSYYEFDFDKYYTNGMHLTRASFWHKFCWCAIILGGSVGEFNSRLWAYSVNRTKTDLFLCPEQAFNVTRS